MTLISDVVRRFQTIPTGSGMPLSTSCPKCSVTGMNRIEHVIHAGHSYRSFECGACGHQWRMLETGEHVPTKDTDSDRPDRSRPSRTHIDQRKRIQS